MALPTAGVCAEDQGVESDWSRIYLGALPTIGGTNGVFAFEWNTSIWTANVNGGVARQLGHSGFEDSWPGAKRVSNCKFHVKFSGIV